MLRMITSRLSLTGKLVLIRCHTFTLLIIYRRVEQVASARGISMVQVALAWILSKNGELTVDFALASQCSSR
jgi:aryl-alcohol dehydrogenase-like predicted oxidoreductase